MDGAEPLSILRNELSALRLATLALAVLVLGAAGAVWFGDILLPVGWIWFLGAPWAVLVAAAPIPDGPGPWLPRLLAAESFPALMMAIGGAAQLGAGAEATRFFAAVAWTAALPLALGAWRQWRDDTAPARLVGTVALAFLGAMHVVLLFDEPLVWLGLPWRSNALVAMTGAWLGLVAVVAPTAWRRWPGVPVFVPLLGAGTWLAFYGFDGLTVAWVGVMAVAWLAPFFAGAPRSSALAAIWRSPVVAAAAIGMLAAVGAALDQPDWLVRLYGSGGIWLVAAVQCYLLRDLLVWRALADISRRERVLPVIWAVWLLLFVILALLLSEAGLPALAIAVFGLPLHASADSGVVVAGAAIGMIVAGVVAGVLARRRAGRQAV